MKNKRNKWILGLTILSVIVTITSLSIDFLLPVYLNGKFQTDAIMPGDTIGVIGSADGPTSILLTNTNSYYFTIIFALLSVIGILSLIFTKRKTK